MVKFYLSLFLTFVFLDDDFPAKNADVHSASHSSVVRPQHSKVHGGHPHPGRRKRTLK